MIVVVFFLRVLLSVEDFPSPSVALQSCCRLFPSSPPAWHPCHLAVTSFLLQAVLPPTPSGALLTALPAHFLTFHVLECSSSFKATFNATYSRKPSMSHHSKATLPPHPHLL